MDDYKNKLKLLMESLEFQNVDEFIKTANINDYEKIGKLYIYLK